MKISGSKTSFTSAVQAHLAAQLVVGDGRRRIRQCLAQVPLQVHQEQDHSVIGVQSRVEIWNEKAWEANKETIEREADTLAEKLGQVGVL